jgi:hypothetical protein
MVSPSGVASTACASFADPAWRQYFVEQYAAFASLGFRVLWVEDDFRYHNHAPLDWGGGFEPEVLDRFSTKVGRAVSREEVVRAILQPGSPHPWRRLWLETWRDVQLEVASDLARAVESSSPRAASLGLMSSHPAVHAVEGRDWGKLFDALSIAGRVAHRPHFAGYSEAPGRSLASSIAMLDVQKTLREPGCEVAPEIENFPFTSWTKSDSLTWSQMVLGMLQGSDALLLDLFPFSGNRPSQEPAIGKLLDASRPALEWIARELDRDLETRGIGAPWKQDAQSHVHTSRGQAMGELDATFSEVPRLLLPYGVPVACRRQRVNAIFGSLAWAFDDREITDLLSGGLLLDGASAAVLQERGYSELIGVEVRDRLERDSSPYAVETVIAEESGVRPGVYLNVNPVPVMYALEPRHGAIEWTSVLAPERPPRGRRLGSGLVCFTNRSGGRVAVIAAESPGGMPQSDHRQTMVQGVTRFLRGPDASPDLDGVLVSGGPHLLPMCFDAPLGAGGFRNVVVVANGNTDPAKPTIQVPGRVSSEVDATLLVPLAKPRNARIATATVDGSATVLAARTAVPSLGYLVLRW